MGGPERIPRSDTEQYGAGGKEDEGEHETKSGGLATQHPRAVRKVVSYGKVVGFGNETLLVDGGDKNENSCSGV